MDFDDFWCKLKLRVCLFCFCYFQHTFVESKTTKTFSEVKSVVFTLPSFQRCRQKWMCVHDTFLHELYENDTQYRNVYKRILNTPVEAYTHQISSQSEHYTRYTVRGRGAKRRTSSEYSKRTRRNVSGTSQRQFEIPTQKSQSAGMESGRNQ